MYNRVANPGGKPSGWVCATNDNARGDVSGGPKPRSHGALSKHKAQYPATAAATHARNCANTLCNGTVR